MDVCGLKQLSGSAYCKVTPVLAEDRMSDEVVGLTQEMPREIIDLTQGKSSVALLG